MRSKSDWTRHQKAPFWWIYSHLRHTAERYGKPFSLSFEDFLKFTAVATCHYCGSPVKWEPSSRFRNPDGSRNGKNKSSRAYYLDRKDNSKGYSTDNCVVCCTLCNKIKSSVLSYDEMMLLRSGLQKIQHQRQTL